MGAALATIPSLPMEMNTIQFLDFLQTDQGILSITKLLVFGANKGYEFSKSLGGRDVKRSYVLFVLL
jgi:hypothetical protein